MLIFCAFKQLELNCTGIPAQATHTRNSCYFMDLEFLILYFFKKRPNLLHAEFSLRCKEQAKHVCYGRVNNELGASFTYPLLVPWH